MTSDPGTPHEGAEELLYQSARTRVVRVTPTDSTDSADGTGSVVRKESFGPDAVRRPRHEAAVLERLAGVDGVPRLLGPPDGTAIVLADVGGAALAGQPLPLDVPALLDLAAGVAGVLTAVHRRGVVHKDVNPANIVLGTAGTPVLVDFDLATTFAEERPDFTHQSEVAGTLAYLAPEQTGRTGRPVDQRADLYAFGATLYTLATGRPPFGEGDALRLIHDHLARVPTPPAELNPALPPMLSAIIMRLLEKEPDQRYQSAEGLRHDLARLRDAPHESFVPRERDFPLRLAPPSRLVGRDAEIAALAAAFGDAARGGSGGLLITGEPGVGKTALIDELRPIVTARGGWFVAGKFDQYREDLDASAVTQAFRAIGRLLLAEPEAALTTLRARLRDALGVNAGLISAVHPELALLLGTPPEAVTAESVNLNGRLVQAGLALLRTVASPVRPVVMVLDDLQWAGPTAIGLVDAVLTDESLAGLLLVGTYRETEVDAAHPLSATLSRWQRLGVMPPTRKLTNLPAGDLATLLADMLRLPPARAAALAEAIGPRTGGNPYDTLELVNALRRDGILVLGADGWCWEEAAIRRYVGHGDVIAILTTRIDALPPPAQEMISVLACLGGEVDPGLLRAATGRSAEDAERWLAPGLEDGLLVMEHSGEGKVRFRHDRVQQAAYHRLSADARRDTHLAVARRLADFPEYAAMAAEQYLPAADAIRDPTERGIAAVLFHEASTTIRLSNHAIAERFLMAATTLLPSIESEGDVRLLATLEAERHAALYNLGRLDEADELFGSIQRRALDPVDMAGAACVQIAGLTNRGRFEEAIGLGLDMLAGLGHPVPEPDRLDDEIERGLDRVLSWVREDALSADLNRPEPTDRRVLAVANIISRLLPPAFFARQTLYAWLTVECQRLWAEHGPCAPLVACLSVIPHVTVGRRQDFRTGYVACRRVLAVGEARGYEPETSQARATYSIFTAPWFEPIEEAVRQAHQAVEGLLHAGETQFAGYPAATTCVGLLEYAPSIDAAAADLEASIALCARTGNDMVTENLLGYRQLLRALRGETDPPGEFTDASFDEATHLARVALSPVGRANYHIARALSAALFGDLPALVTHAEAVAPILPYLQTLHMVAIARLLQALAFAERAKTAPPDGRAGPLAGLDECRDWLAARAADSPGNYSHLVRLVVAERAWAVGDVPAALRGYDEALDEVTRRPRPWHRALVNERAGRFHLAHGVGHLGRLLLVEARRCYHEWGAVGRVRELEREFGLPRLVETALPAHQGTVHSTSMLSDAIDLLGVLKASQTLSTETNLDRLRDRVVEVLSALTGATAVRVLLWNDGARDWYLPGDASAGGGSVSVERAGASGLLPLSAFRYAERTREPLLIDDTGRDDRFARDPYLTRLGPCSLLVVPILTQGAPRAMLLLENRLSRGAFTADRLDAVMLIAGQLAVSLDNALAERFRSLVQRSSDLILVCDQDGVLTYVSAASTEILGVADATLTGRPVVDLVHPDDRAALRGRLRDTGRPETETLECQAPHADGSLRWVEITFTDLTTDPAVRGVMLRLRDITERRRLEVELHHAQKLESVGRLAAGIAHEINTPIQFIGDNVRFLQTAFGDLLRLQRANEEIATAVATAAAGRDAATADAGTGDAVARADAVAAEVDVEFLVDEVPTAIEQTIDGVDRVATIVRAMKAFGYTNNEDKMPADLNEAINNTLVVATSETKFVADVHCDFADLPPVVCHIGDINQVVLNLVVNAAHAIDTAGRGRGTITVATRTDGGHVLIEVTDTGTGIPAHIGDKIFEPFFTTKEVGTGTGQGLALARSLVVDRHNGTITFTTEPGVGTTFTIRLPVAGSTVAAAR